MKTQEEKQQLALEFLAAETPEYGKALLSFLVRKEQPIEEKQLIDLCVQIANDILERYKSSIASEHGWER